MSQSYMCHSNNGIYYTTAGSFHKRAICKAKFGLLLKKDPGIIQQSYVIQGLGFVLYSKPEALTLPLQPTPAFVCMCVFGGATQSNTIQRTATHGNTRQHTATHCNTMQHTATHWQRAEKKNRARVLLRKEDHARASVFLQKNTREGSFTHNGSFSDRV